MTVILSVVYVEFKKKYYHLHEEYLRGLKQKQEINLFSDWWIMAIGYNKFVVFAVYIIKRNLEYEEL